MTLQKQTLPKLIEAAKKVNGMSADEIEKRFPELMEELSNLVFGGILERCGVGRDAVYYAIPESARASSVSMDY